MSSVSSISSSYDVNWENIFYAYATLYGVVFLAAVARLIYIIVLVCKARKRDNADLTVVGSGLDMTPKIVFFTTMVVWLSLRFVCYVVLPLTTTDLFTPNTFKFFAFNSSSDVSLTLLIIVVLCIWSKTLEITHRMYSENNIHPRVKPFAMFCRLPLAASKVMRITLFIIFGMIILASVICFGAYGNRLRDSSYSAEFNKQVPELITSEVFLIIGFFIVGLLFIMQCILIGLLYHQEGACKNPTQVKILAMGIPVGLLVFLRSFAKIVTLTEAGTAPIETLLYIIFLDLVPGVLMIVLMWPVVKDKEKEEAMLVDLGEEEKPKKRKLKSQRMPDRATDDDLALSDRNESLTKALNQYEDDSQHHEKRRWFFSWRE